jgi:aarF domain-containing kinase
MRGAALKVGQMLSIQDESLLPPQLQQVLNRVRDSADVMPRAQLERTLRAELGDGWERKLSSFDWSPIAAASIGQVHRGVEAEGGRAVVLKVQYPGVADSISSDVNNVRLLIRLFNVLPPGLYADQTMQAAKEELSVECDYRNEADSQTAFQQLIRSSPLHPRVNVPSVVPVLSTSRVLTSEWVAGVPIDHCARDGRNALSQERRNSLCLRLLRLCLLEVFSFRFMQTDPNWSNFLYEAEGDVLHCIDFGASREYEKAFVDEYMRMVAACANQQRDALIDSSIKLGFLTGQESRQMLDAHVAAGFIVGEPFSLQYEQGYDFARMDMGRRVSELARVMLRLRLTPPPKDSYTLHRKLSGCFLTCKRLEAVIPCRETFLEIYNQYRFGPEQDDDGGGAERQRLQQPGYSSDSQPLGAAVHAAH